MEVREKCDSSEQTPVLLSNAPEFWTQGHSNARPSQMSREISRDMHKADLIKEYRWGVREGLVKPCFLLFIQGFLFGSHWIKQQY